MKIKLSINKNIINKENPSANGWHRVEMSPDELMQSIMQGYAFSPGYLKENTSGKKPSNDDIEFSELLVVDVDNTIAAPTNENPKNKRKREISEGYMDYNNVATNQWSHNNILFIYTTPSHTEEHHRFRIVFKLPMPINNADDYKKVSQPIIARLKGDPAASTISNTFFGSKDCQYKIFGATLTKRNLDLYCQTPKQEEKAIKDYNNSGLNGQIPPEVVADMLSHIPAEMEYYEWFKIVSAVGNYFPNDLDTACKLIDDWSPDTERGTMWRLKHRGNKATIGSVIFYATANGYEKAKLAPYQKNGKKLSDRSVNAEGKISKRTRKSDKPTVQDIQDYLLERYEFRYNVIKSYVEFKKVSDTAFSQVTDRVENSLWCELDGAGLNIPVGDLTKILMSDFVPEYHPFKEYFGGLPSWDEADHIQSFVDAVKVQEGQEEVWRDYFTRWIVSTVACATETIRRDFKARSVNHTCIVLVGDQGLGKSTIINRLVPEQLSEYYAVAQINPNEKDSKILVTENFLINLDELESSTREEMASLKSLMTVEQIVTRKPYGRRSESYFRRASFIGSVNKAMFLTDITGSRRFLPVDVESIDFTAQIDIDQLYAQAMYYLHEINFKYWFDGQEIKAVDELNRKYQVISPEEELVNKYFKPYEADDKIDVYELKKKEASGLIRLMTATEIYDSLQSKTEVKMSYHKLGQILKNLGFHQKHVRKDKVVKRCYLVSENNKDDSIDF